MSILLQGSQHLFNPVGYAELSTAGIIIELVIVDNDADAVILFEFLHQILEFDILKRDKSLLPSVGIEVGDGSDSQLAIT